MEQVKLNTFGRYPTWVRPRLRGKFAAVTALTELVCLMDNKKNTVRISHARLAQRMGCGVSTVRRALDVLVAEGIVLREASLHTSNVYTVLFGGESVDWDDWETLGEDPETQKVPAVKGRIPRLVSFFAAEVSVHVPKAVQSTVNAKALGKHIKEMLDEQGVTEHQLKTMITLFAVDLERGDRFVEDIPPWRMFLADRQKLLTRVREGTEDIVYIDEMPPAE